MGRVDLILEWEIIEQMWIGELISDKGVDLKIKRIKDIYYNQNLLGNQNKSSSRYLYDYTNQMVKSIPLYGCKT